VKSREGSALIVEDDALIALSLADMLESMGFSVCGTADTAQRAVDLAALHRPSLVLMDVRLRGERDGVDAAREIQERAPARIIFVTGSCEQEIVERINAIRPAGLLIKPVMPEQLKVAVESAFR
jgi:DNA-binding NarL/FixJ family response regulator